MALLVVIKTTPKAALDPYMAAEEASFNTDTLSTSFGLTRLGSPSIPSISTRALPPAPIEVVPRILNVAPLVGLPSTIFRLRLGNAPCNILVSVGAGLLSNTSALTCATAPVRFNFFWVP